MVVNWRTIEQAIKDFCRQEGQRLADLGGDIHTHSRINVSALARYLEKESERWPTK